MKNKGDTRPAICETQEGKDSPMPGSRGKGGEWFWCGTTGGGAEHKASAGLGKEGH